jgi:MFS family permease
LIGRYSLFAHARALFILWLHDSIDGCLLSYIFDPASSSPSHMGAESPPWGLRWRASTLFIIATVAVGLFTDLFLYGLIVPILPFMLRDRVDLPEEKVQSYVSAMLAAYAGASVVFSLPAGIIADKVRTRQAPFLSGLAALLAATLMLAFGQSIPVLIVARVLQGTSSAFVWTVCLAMILDTVGPGNLGKTIGSVSADAVL